MNTRWTMLTGVMLISGLAITAAFLGCKREISNKPTTKPPPNKPTATPFGAAPVSLAKATEFLYTGSNAPQTGVKAGSIEPNRAAILRGQVRSRDGLPLPGVEITILHHPEFGSTLSFEDGTFDFAVNGGGQLCVNYQKKGYLSACRDMVAPWQDYAWLQDVVLIPADKTATTVDLKPSAPIQVARGSRSSDADGERQTTLLVPQGVEATMVLPRGGQKRLNKLTVRATEYTVGSNGFAAMPVPLPPRSAYTYAVELSADEAAESGAKYVRFNKPLYHYVENFLNFPVGIAVPTGYYDREKAAWIGSEDGHVIKVLGINNGLAELDVDGKGKIADTKALARLGVVESELRQLATLYKAGASLWRVPIQHFSIWDFNWGFGPPKDAAQPDSDTEKDDYVPGSCYASASIIDIHNQFLGEMLPVTGTPFRLHYNSNRRSAANKSALSLKIRLTGKTVPQSLKRVELEVVVAGQRYNEENLPAKPNQSHTFNWDGKDGYGRNVNNQQPVTVRVGYVYDGAYQAVERFGDTGNGIPITGSRTRREVVLWREHKSWIGGWDSSAQGLGGWSLDKHHAYDPLGQVLYMGNGTRRTIQQVWSLQMHNRPVTTFAGGGKKKALGDGGPAAQARLDYIGPEDRGSGVGRDRYAYPPAGMALAPDGSVYIIDANNRVRRVALNGSITTVAGGGKKEAGDRGPADQVKLHDPNGIALAGDGSLYIAETGNNRVRRVGADGMITTVAGTGGAGFSGDGGLATQAQLNEPTSIAIPTDGSLYIADMKNHRIRRVGVDGIITTVAGAPSEGDQALWPGYGGDHGPATQARLYWPNYVVVAGDGSLYISDTGNFLIRRVAPGGIITTVAGTPPEEWAKPLRDAPYNELHRGFSGDLGPAAKATLEDTTALAFGPDGALYIADTQNHRIRRIGREGIVINTVAGTNLTENFRDGTFLGGDGGPATHAPLSYPAGIAIGPDNAMYIYDGCYTPSRGAPPYWRVRKVAPPPPGSSNDEIVIPSEDGSEVYRFSGSGQHLETLHAATQIRLYKFHYGAEGRLIKVEDGYGNVTSIEREPNGQPRAILAPFGQRTTLSVAANGYLASITNPAGESTHFSYSIDGLLATLKDPRDNTYRFTYDAMGRLIKDESPDGGFTALTRTKTATGFGVTLLTALKPPTTYLVEKFPNGEENRVNTCGCGTETKVRIEKDGTRTIQHSDGSISTLVEQPDPRWGMESPLLKSSSLTTPGGLKSTFSLERELELANPDNPLSLRSFTDTLEINGRKYTRTFDVAKKKTTITTPGGRQTVTTLDDQGRVVQTEVPGLLPVSFKYDPKGRLTGVSQGSGAEARSMTLSYDTEGRIATATDALNRSMRFEYDRAGRVTKELSPDESETAYSYDANGNRKSVTPPGRTAHVFDYTANNLVRQYQPPAIGAGSKDTAYAYDQDKRLTKVTRPDDKTIELGYDKAGRREALAVPGGKVHFTSDEKTGQIRSITTPSGDTISYTYDGFLVQNTAWAGAVKGSVNRTFDNDFRVASLKVNGTHPIEYKYDEDGRLTQAGALSLSHDPANGFLTETKLGDVTTTQEYDGFGDKKQFRAMFNGKEIFSARYERDVAGRITRIIETVEGKEITFTYDYDRAGRLKDVTRNGNKTAHYDYDSNGNRLAFKGENATLSGTYDNQDRLTKYGDTTYSHTANGECSSKTIDGKTSGYDYDVFGNHRSVSLPDGTKIEYLIDGINRRIGKKVNGKLIQGFLYQDRLKPIAELDGDNKVVSRFFYATKINVPDYLEKDGKTYRIITDHLGSPRLVIEAATGAIVQLMDYDEFGNVLQDTLPGFQPFGFGGGIYDQKTKLTRFGLRDYDPFTGGWTAKDPIGFSSGDVNLYRYVLGDPMNRVDVTGQGWKDWADAIFRAINLVDDPEEVLPIEHPVPAIYGPEVPGGGAAGPPEPPPGVDREWWKTLFEVVAEVAVDRVGGCFFWVVPTFALDRCNDILGPRPESCPQQVY